MLAASALLALVSMSPTTQDASPAAHETARRWKNVDAIELEVLDTAPTLATPRAVSALDAAAASWNAIGAGPVIHIGRAPAGADENPIANDGKNRVGVYPGAWPWPKEVGAVTLVWPSADEDGNDDGGIAEVDLAINPSFDWSLDPDGKIGAYDVQNVLTHELGHALGLPDVKDSREATMFFVVLPGETLKRDLSHEDEAMIVKLYDNIDLADSGCSAAKGNGDVGAITTGLSVVLAALAAFRRKR